MFVSLFEALCPGQQFFRHFGDDMSCSMTARARYCGQKHTLFASRGPAIDPQIRHILLWKNNFPIWLFQEEQVVR